MMKRAAKATMVVVLSAVALLAQGGSGARGESPAEPRPPVRVATAALRDIPVTFSAVGRVQAANTVLIRSRVDGPITRVLFSEGDWVREGDVLFEIDPRPYQTAVDQAEGALARDQALLASARSDFDRTAQLLNTGFASRQAYDRQAAQLAQGTAAVKVDQAALDNARLNLSFTRLLAPIGGRIGKRLVDAGNLVRASDGTALAEIVQVHPISVFFSVPQSLLNDMRVRQKTAEVEVDAATTDDRRLLAKGRLSLIGNQVDPQTGTIELKAVFANGDDVLWPGQLVEARIVIGTRHDAVTVPMTAIAPGPQGKFVYVVAADSRISVRNIATGPTADGLTVVEFGLSAGERVVVEKQDLLAPGMTITPEAASGEDVLTGQPGGRKGKPS